MILQHTSALYTYLLTYIWWISTKCGETVGNPDTWHSTFEPCGLIFHLLDLKINPEWQCLKIIACTKFGDREFNRLIIFFIPSTRIRSYIVRQAAEIAISDGDKANRPQSRFYASFDCAGNRFTTYADFICMSGPRNKFPLIAQTYYIPVIMSHLRVLILICTCIRDSLYTVSLKLNIQKLRWRSLAVQCISYEAVRNGP